MNWDQLFRAVNVMQRRKERKKRVNSYNCNNNNMSPSTALQMNCQLYSYSQLLELINLLLRIRTNLRCIWTTYIWLKGNDTCQVLGIYCWNLCCPDQYVWCLVVDNSQFVIRNAFLNGNDPSNGKNNLILRRIQPVIKPFRFLRLVKNHHISCNDWLQSSKSFVLFYFGKFDESKNNFQMRHEALIKFRHWLIPCVFNF